MLVHHADAARQGGLGPSRRQALAERLDAALVGYVMAEQDVHQRGLAGAVLAQQRQDLSSMQIEADRIVGQQRAEPLGDAGEAEDDVSSFRSHYKSPSPLAGEGCAGLARREPSLAEAGWGDARRSARVAGGEGLRAALFSIPTFR